MSRRGLLLLLFALVFAATPALAHAAVWTEGTAVSPFQFSDSGGLIISVGQDRNQVLSMPLEAVTAFDGRALEFEPRSIRRDSRDGSYLVACGKHGYVLRILPNGTYRLYTAANIPGLERPFDAYPLPDGGMMIVDRGTAAGEGRVIRVDADNHEVWRFGGTSGLGAGQIWDPFSAEPLPGGRTLIADSLGFRVIEIVDATGEIVWSYGTFNVSGPGPGLLNRPHSAQRLASGNTLICDAEGNRVIEVNSSGATVWSFGTGASGPGPNQVFNPNSAVRIEQTGETIISDSDNNRVIVVDRAGSIVRSYGGPAQVGGLALSNPRAAMMLADGSTLIADLGNMRLTRYGYQVAREYVATSGLIDPSVGVFKSFKRITVNGSAPPLTSLGAEYATGNGNWKAIPPGGVLPASATGTAIRYRLRLMTSSGTAAPSVDDVAITWDVSTPVTTKKSTTPTAKSSGSSSSTGASTTGGTSRTGVQSGVTAPGADAPVASGVAGTSGDLASGATPQTTMSGWVMSETKEDASWAGAAGSESSPGQDGRLQKSAVPGVTLLFGAYLVGIAWSPGTRAIAQLIATMLPH